MLTLNKQSLALPNLHNDIKLVKLASTGATGATKPCSGYAQDLSKAQRK